MVPLEQWSRTVDDVDDLEPSNKASQMDVDPLATPTVIDGAESLPMLIELTENPEDSGQTGLREDGIDYSALNATPTESNHRVDDEQRRMLDELFRFVL